MNDTRTRTIVKTLTYRLTAWAFTIFWTYLFVEDVAGATIFSTLLHIALSIDYYIHERIWDKITWGKSDGK